MVQYRIDFIVLFLTRNSHISIYSEPSSYDRPDIRTWVTTKVLSYDPNAGQGQNVYRLVRL
jgi:hypothetical protein